MSFPSCSLQAVAHGLVCHVEHVSDLFLRHVLAVVVGQQLTLLLK